MKAQSTGNKYERGMATLEVLIAFAILILCIGAVIMIVFGNQSVSIDTETNNEALYKAKKILEDARALSKENYMAVLSSATVSTSVIPFTEVLTINEIAQCKKEAISTVTWSSSGRDQKIELSTFFTDIYEAIALGGDCDSVPPTEWDNPITAASVGIGGQGSTDIDVRNNLVYLSSSASDQSKDDLFIYQFDPLALTLTEQGKINSGKGLNAVDNVDDYAFALNNDTTKHLVVFDVSDPTTPTLVASTTLPNILTGVARSIFYYDDFVYIGTQYVPCPSCPTWQNNEFHIYNVTNPASPAWSGSFNVNHNINEIIVRGDYAYLATSDDNGEIYIYNISTPSNITLVGKFDANGSEDAQSIYLIGTKLYFGRDRTPSTRQDFYILDVQDPANPTELGSKNLSLNPNTSVTGIIVKSYLAFVGIDNPTSGLKILDISNPTNITYHPICTSLNFAENSTALEMDANFIFSAGNSNDEIRVIHDQASSCS